MTSWSRMSRPRVLLLAVLAAALMPHPSAAQQLPEPADGLVDVFHGALEGAAPDDDASVLSETASAAPSITMRGSGWGHSVGMSQYGARAQAQAGRSVNQILTHYYPGVGVGTNGSLEAGHEVRVELFGGRVGDEAAQQMRLAARGRDGSRPPTTAATVRLAPDRAVRALPPPAQAFTLARDGGDFVLRDADDRELERGPGPVVLAVAPPGGANPGVLCLPQRGCAADSLPGTFQWGYVAVAWDSDAERMRPVLRVPMELYLRGLAEMPSSWEMPALQAQAIAGRTYATRRVRGAPDASWHLDTTPRTQAYAGWEKEGGVSGGRWVQAVDSTTRGVVTYRGALAETFYSSSHGGRSEDVQDSWAFGSSTEQFPYLRSVDDPWSLAGGNPYAAWNATVSNHEFVRAVREETGVARIASIGVRDRTAGGTPRTLEVRGWDADGRTMTASFRGGKNAGAVLRKRWPTREDKPFLRSQQIGAFSVSPFADDDGSAHEYNIWLLAARGITTGCDPANSSRYCPTATLSRGQMATFLARALDLRVDPNEPDRFRDIAGSPHRAAINAIAREGITGGCTPDGLLFCPAAGVTRDQMASFLARGFDLPPGREQGYTDVPPTNPHRDAINRVASEGITAGCAPNRYCPRDGVTRGQMASFVGRALGEGW